MNDAISKSAVIQIIEDKQRELCPLGNFSRNALYGSDRDAFDKWQEIIDAIENLPAIDAEPVIFGRWVEEPGRSNRWHCSNCREAWDTYQNS